jgi:hypothetical protein
MLLGDMVIYKPNVSVDLHKPVLSKQDAITDSADNVNISRSDVVATSQEDSITDRKSDSTEDSKTTVVANPNVFSVVIGVLIFIALIAAGYLIYRKYRPQSS